MHRTLALIGAPSSAGAHWPGQEKAPGFLREAGLIERLRSGGFEVIDRGDLATKRFRPDKENRRQQNLESVVGVCREVCREVEAALDLGAVPLVVGGDCTVGIGVVAAFVNRGLDPSLLYFDGHVDLNTPATSRSGILDSMGIAHMVGERGSAAALAHLGARYPLMAPARIVLFGFNPREMNGAEVEALARLSFVERPCSAIAANPVEAATEVRANLEGIGRPFLVHLDVDVIDFTDLPIGNVPQFGGGIRFQDAMDALAVFASSPRFAALTVAELNPDHTDPTGEDGRRFVDGLAGALIASHGNASGASGARP